MSSKQDLEFDAFLSDGLGSFGHLNLDEKPCSQEMWQEMLEEIEGQHEVKNVLTEDCCEMDDLSEEMDAFFLSQLER